MSQGLRTRLAHLLLVLVGLVAIGYGLSLGGASEIRCRGEVMVPGSVCVKSDGSEGQSYEQRLATRRTARPVVVGVGVLVTGFGGYLLLAELRRRDRSAVEDAG